MDHFHGLLYIKNKKNPLQFLNGWILRVLLSSTHPKLMAETQASFGRWPWAIYLPTAACPLFGLPSPTLCLVSPGVETPYRYAFLKFRRGGPPHRPLSPLPKRQRIGKVLLILLPLKINSLPLSFLWEVAQHHFLCSCF